MAFVFSLLSLERLTSRWSRCVVGGLGALVVAAGAAGCGGGSTTTSTQPAGGGKTHGETIGAVAAGYLGISRAQLHHELARGRTLAEVANSTPGHTAKGLAEAILKVRLARLESEVKEGKLSQAQLETRMTTEKRHVENRLAHADVVAVSVVAAAAAHYLHVSEARLRAERAKGRSLAQVAASVPGHSAKGLVAAIVAAEQARLRRSGHAAGSGAPSAAELRRRVTIVVFHKPTTATGKSKGKEHKAKGSSGESTGGESASGQAASEEE